MNDFEICKARCDRKDSNFVIKFIISTFTARSSTNAEITMSLNP